MTVDESICLTESKRDLVRGLHRQTHVHQGTGREDELQALHLPLRSLLIFIDETGNEDFSDPNNPTFGRGGCGALMTEYKPRIARPWRKVKRERLGGALKPFHATEFEQTRPTMHQITGINTFMARPFWRFATMCDSRTELPAGIDAHKAISLVTIGYFASIVSHCDVDVVALIFEASNRGDSLVRRDYDLANMDLTNQWGRRVEVEGCFMPKGIMEPGLEVADLIAHTAGRQRRHELAGKIGHTKDFQQTYWHSPIPPKFMAISSVEIAKAVEAGQAVPQRNLP
jgi:hypothetical protein